jgi:ketosteroid isomerase-like protein
MSNANVAFVQSLYAAFGRGEIGTIIASMTPDADWKINGRREDYPLCGDWKGQAGVQKFFQALGEHQDTISFTPKDFYAAHDRVFVLGNYVWKLRKNGRQVDSDWCHVFTVKDGKVTKFQEFTDTAQFAGELRA